MQNDLEQRDDKPQAAPPDYAMALRMVRELAEKMSTDDWYGERWYNKADRVLNDCEDYLNGADQ